MLLLSCLAAETASADPWLAPGDGQMRHDLQLLSDAGIVHAPLTTWPVSWAEVARDVRSIGDDPARPMYIAAALARVRAAARQATVVGDLALNARIAGSERPMQLRRFSDVPREEGEISAGAQYTGDRLALRLQATAVSNASDGKNFRADGSYAGVVLGNWMLSAGFIDRWWGPGWEGSLIYGSNARPIPSVTIERNFSDPFEKIGVHLKNAQQSYQEADRRLDKTQAALDGMLEAGDAPTDLPEAQQTLPLPPASSAKSAG